MINKGHLSLLFKKKSAVKKVSVDFWNVNAMAEEMAEENAMPEENGTGRKNLIFRLDEIWVSFDPLKFRENEN